MKTIGDRMKENYENRHRHYLTRRTPVVIRVDGKAFHTFTAKMDKPFDHKFMASMVLAAEYVAMRMQGFKAAYVQSDEASFLLTDYDNFETEAWFDYNKSKLESVTAALMTAGFIQAYFSMLNKNICDIEELPCFDARAFNLPREEVVNYFRWRALDWERNSLSMYARSFFSQKQLHGVDRAGMHELLHSVGKNWATDLPLRDKNGTYLTVASRLATPLRRDDITTSYSDISNVLDPFIDCDKQNTSKGVT